MDDKEQIAALERRLAECQSELNGRRITGEMGVDRYCAVALLRNEVEQLRGRLAEAEAACAELKSVADLAYRHLDTYGVVAMLYQGGVCKHVPADDPERVSQERFFEAYRKAQAALAALPGKGEGT